MRGLDVVAFKSFKAVCFFAASIMMIKGTIKFWMDENASVISYESFHETSKDIYPSFSICLNSGLIRYKEHQKGSPKDHPRYGIDLYNLTVLKEKYGIKPESTEKEIRNYISFLMGENNSYGKGDLKMEYDNVSLNLNNYLKFVRIVSGDTILYEWKPHSMKEDPFKISYRHPTMKCFSFDISESITDEAKKGKTLSTISFSLDSNVPMLQRDSTLTMAFYLHYPDQLMRSNALEIIHLGKHWPIFRKQFWVDTIEVIRNRNTRHSPCNMNNDKDDEWIKKKLIKNAKCTPPHWPVDDEYKERCVSVDQLLKVLTPSLETTNPEFLNQFKDDQPCDQIHSISFTFKDLQLPPDCAFSELLNKKDDLRNTDQHILNPHQLEMIDQKFVNQRGKKIITSGMTRQHIKYSPTKKMDIQDMDSRCVQPDMKTVEIHFKSPLYKEIKQIKDFCLESWVGNVGGYIGLFLGYAICQLPELIDYVITKLRWI